MRPHKRNYVIVRGEINNHDTYFDRASSLAQKFALDSGAVLIGYDLRDKPGDGISELVSNSREFCDKLAEKLRKIDSSKSVEVGTHVVDLSNPFRHN